MSTQDERRAKVLEDYRKKVLEHRNLDDKLRSRTYFILFVVVDSRVVDGLISSQIGIETARKGFRQV